MHIFFDQTIFMEQRYGGISRYICELGYHLASAQNIKVIIFGGWTKNAYLQAISKHPNLKCVFLKRRDSFRINSIAKQFSRLWQRAYFVLCIKNKKRTIYHSSFFEFDPYIKKHCVGMVTTFHDMIAEMENGQAKYSKAHLRNKALAAEHCNQILVVSKNTQKDLLKQYPSTRQKSHVTYLGSSLSLPKQETPSIDKLPKNYFLIIGNRSGYKNGLNSLKAFYSTNKAYPHINLVLCGGPPLSADEKKILQDAEKNVLQIHVNDQSLCLAYQKAIALLYPSLYEGFGIPVLEAMRNNCPVITSHKSSLPEVAGDAGIYCDPEDAINIAKLMKKLSEDENFRKKYIKKGQVQSKNFSWEITAQKTAEIYKKVLP